MVFFIIYWFGIKSFPWVILQGDFFKILPKYYASNQLTSDGGCTNDSFFCSGDFSILTVQLLLRWWHFGLVQHLWFSQYSLLVQVFRFFSTLSIFHRVVAATFSLLNLRVCCCFIFVLIFQKIFLNLQLIYSKCTLWFLPDIS